MISGHNTCIHAVIFCRLGNGILVKQRDIQRTGKLFCDHRKITKKCLAFITAFHQHLLRIKIRVLGIKCFIPSANRRKPVKAQHRNDLSFFGKRKCRVHCSLIFIYLGQTLFTGILIVDVRAVGKHLKLHELWIFSGHFLDICTLLHRLGLRMLSCDQLLSCVLTKVSKQLLCLFACLWIDRLLTKCTHCISSYSSPKRWIIS